MKLDKFINRPVLSTVISIFILILGIIGLESLPIEKYPDIAPPTIRVRTSYTGANAQTVMNSVIAPLEEAINGVENMTYMSSSATNDGVANINVYFKQGSDPDMAAVNVQNRVAKAQGLLPAEVTKVGVITSKRQTSMLLTFSLYSSDDKYDQKFIQNYANINLLPQIMRVPGVGDASAPGTKDYTMRIWLKPEIMAQYKLMPSDISGALDEQNIEAAPGQFGENGGQSFQYIMKSKGRLQTTEEFGDIVIRASKDGSVLRLKDVARIELGAQQYSVNNYMNGHPSVSITVYQTPGSNATEIINNVTKLLKESEKTLPAGLKYNLQMNANDFLYASIWEVLKTLLEAFILVMLVVYIFLQDFRSTLIPAIAIPVALVGTFFVLKIFGFSINLLTLSALVLAIAIVVDDAIVVVEAVHAKLDKGYKSSRVASIDAMSEISGAILSITLVMMAVFIPVSFMGGTSGVFYRQFGITMAVAIGFSALNALTLSPALCAIFLKPKNLKAKDGKKTTFVNRFHIAFNTTYDILLVKYKKSVIRIIKNKWISLIAVVIGFVILVVLMELTPTGMVPNEDTGSFNMVINMAPGTSLERTEETMEKVNDILKSNPLIESSSQVSGYGTLAGSGSSYGTFMCKLKDWDERKGKGQDVNSIIDTLYKQTSKIKDAKVLIFAPPMIPGYSATNGFEVNLQDKTGGDINAFNDISQNFITKLQERPEIARAQTSFSPKFPQYQVDVDAAKCKQADISPNKIFETLQGYYGGMYVSNFNRFGKLYRVYLQADAKYRISPETLNSIFVKSGDEMAPISQFMTIKKVYGPQVINRFNMFTSIAINGSPADGYTSGQAIKAIEEVANENLPVGYGYEFSGISREEQGAGTSTTAIVFALCLIFVYLLLSAQYESYVLPLVVILSIPFGLAGSFIFAKIFGYENNIYLQIALIMLIGLLAKNSILITEFALQRRKYGMSIISSAVSGASARLRPILMTSLAMIIGLLPLMFASGVGANSNRTLGGGAVGGMLIGMLCQIFIVPALFVIFEYLQEKFKPLNKEKMVDNNIIPEIEHYNKIDY